MDNRPRPLPAASRSTLSKITLSCLLSISAGASWAQNASPASDPGVVTFGGQKNAGNQTAGIEIQHVVVDEVKINSTALGNNLSVKTNDVFRSNGEMQHNTGNQNASVAVRGVGTNFRVAEINATALGNNASYMGIGTESLQATTARQLNEGNQGASIVWDRDPSGMVELNATALGNNLSIGRK